MAEPVTITAPHKLRALLATMKSAKEQRINMNIWDRDIAAVEGAIETIEGIRSLPRRAGPAATPWRTDLENAPSPCIGWCSPPAGDVVRQIWHDPYRKGEWSAHGVTQTVKAWQALPSMDAALAAPQALTEDQMRDAAMQATAASERVVTDGYVDRAAKHIPYVAAPQAQEAATVVSLTEGQERTLRGIANAKAAGISLHPFWLEVEREWSPHSRPMNQPTENTAAGKASKPPPDR